MRIPEALIRRAARFGRKPGRRFPTTRADGFGLGKLLETRQIKKISPAVGENTESTLYLAEAAELEFTPCSTLAEKFAAPAAQASRLLRNKTGVGGTMAAEGK